MKKLVGCGIGGDICLNKGGRGGGKVVVFCSSGSFI